VQGQRVWPRAYRQKQALGRGLLLFDGGSKGLPFVRVLVGAGEQRGGNAADFLRQFTGQQLVCPALLLFRLLPFFLDGGQGCLQDVGRRRPVAAFAAAVKIGRRAVQGEDQGGLFDCTGRMAVVVLCECGGFELFL